MNVDKIIEELLRINELNELNPTDLAIIQLLHDILPLHLQVSVSAVIFNQTTGKRSRGDITVYKLIRATINAYKKIEEQNIALEKVYTVTEAEKGWGLPAGSIRRDIHRGKFSKQLEKRLIKHADMKTWLIHHQAMIEVYGEKE